MVITIAVFAIRMGIGLFIESIYFLWESLKAFIALLISITGYIYRFITQKD